MVMTFYHPPARRYDQAVLIGSAMAVSQRFFVALAHWLANQGMLVVMGHFGFFRPGNEESLWRPLLLPVLTAD